jgi:NADH:ubiquinone oxidoreductase subunit H
MFVKYVTLKIMSPQEATCFVYAAAPVLVVLHAVSGQQ